MQPPEAMGTKESRGMGQSGTEGKSRVCLRDRQSHFPQEYSMHISPLKGSILWQEIVSRPVATSAAS